MDELSNLLFQRSSPELALLHTTMFVPNFIVHGDDVFLDDGCSSVIADFKSKRASSTMNHRDAVDSYNWRDLADMFINNDFDDAVYERLAQAIAEAWRARLHLLFPERQFIVETYSPEVTGYGVGVGFREVKNTG